MTPLDPSAARESAAIFKWHARNAAIADKRHDRKTELMRLKASEIRELAKNEPRYKGRVSVRGSIEYTVNHMALIDFPAVD